MKKLPLLALCFFSTALLTHAEEQQAPDTQNRNAAPDFALTSAASAPTGTALPAFLNVGPIVSGPSFAWPNTTPISSSSNMASSDPQSWGPIPHPEDQEIPRLEIGLGFTLVRFRSSVFYATAAGLNTSVGYFLNRWFGVEGQTTAAFAPAIFNHEDVRFASYGAGPKFIWRGDRLQPWAHAILGGAHVNPQAASGGQNGLLLEAGAGVDYRIRGHFYGRIEANWLRSSLYSQTQNSGQAIAGVVYHF